MSCSSAEELFERALDGRLDPAARPRFQAHLDQCAGCRSLLEELRVVDALLMQPRRVELAANFTFAILAETRALPPPARDRAPVRAYLGAYVAGSWLLTGVAYLVAPHTVRAVSGTVIDLAWSTGDVIAGVGAATTSALDHGGTTVTAIFGTLLALDVVVALGFVAAFRTVRTASARRAS